VEIGSIDNEVGAIVEARTLLGREAPSRARKVIRSGDVLFATTRPYLRNIALVPEKYDDQVCTTGMCVLRADPKLIAPLWLYHLCRSQIVLDQVEPKMRGASYPAVTDSDVLESLIPLPPLDEQRRIVARIEALFARIEEVRRLRSIAGEEATRLMEATLAEIFPRPDGELQGEWEIKSVAEISEKPQYGYTQSAKWEPPGPKFLRISDIQEGQVDWEAVPYCEYDKPTLDKHRLESGDLVFARSGATTGKTFLVKKPPEAVFASYLIRLQIHQVSPEYVYWFFQSPYYWEQVRPRGAAQPNMNARILSHLKVPIPKSEDVQRRIVSYLNEVQDQVRALKKSQETLEAELDCLEQSILAQAFRGEL
jgi:type I restriction enzyme S subunit